MSGTSSLDFQLLDFSFRIAHVFLISLATSVLSIWSLSTIQNSRLFLLNQARFPSWTSRGCTNHPLIAEHLKE